MFRPLIVGILALFTTLPPPSKGQPDARPKRRVAAQPNPAVQQPSIRPQWQVGDEWTVQATTPAVQVRRGPDEEPLVTQARWQFRVAEVTPLAGRDCFRVTVRPAGQQAARQDETPPTAQLWVDRQTLTLRQVQVRLPSRGGAKTLTERYSVSEDRPTPVITPLTAIPIDLPAFTPDGIKSLEPFAYEALPGGEATKELGEVGFAVSVSQQVGDAADERVKSLAAEPFTKNLTDATTKEVRIATPDRSVKQLWQTGQPWPIHSDNGLTTTTLIEVRRATQQPEEDQ